MPTPAEPRAWYALRRTLVPWNFDAALDELIDFCRAYAVDEVILKCDTEEFSHGIPAVTWLQAYQPKLIQAREALTTAGVVYSLNPWVTQGHTDRGRDIRPIFPRMRMQVGHDGTETKAQACPICEEWRRVTGELWTLYAETHPHVIWVEDDIRTFNHLPVRLGCFCAAHLHLFGERLGEPVTREELVAAILAPGAPHPWRQVWLDLQGDVMIDTVRFLQETVHHTSPETRMGLMSSGPDNHAMEGRRWSGYRDALAGSTPFYSRPPLGSYNEVSLQGLYYTAHSIQQTRHCLPADTIEQSEVENWPFTQYSKSTTFTGLQMAVSYALGCEGCTLNLFDHIGTPLSDEAIWGEMLKQRKPFFHGLADRCQGKAPCGGVRLLHSERAGYAMYLPPRGDFYHLAQDAASWHEPLKALGFPTTYDESPVIAVTGQGLRAFSHEQITDVLSRGVLLDGVAADTLCKMGYADMIGVAIDRIIDKNELPGIAAEDWYNPAFGGHEKQYMTMTLPDLGGGARIAVMQPFPGAIEISRLVDMEHQRLGSYVNLFVNALGGRIAVFPLVIEPGRFLSMLNPIRKRQFSMLMHWLSNGTLPLEITVQGGAYPLPIMRRYADHVILGAFNLMLDTWTAISFDLHVGARRITGIEQLGTDGRWVRNNASVTEQGSRAVITLAGDFPYSNPVFLDVALG